MLWGFAVSDGLAHSDDAHGYNSCHPPSAAIAGYSGQIPTLIGDSRSDSLMHHCPLRRFFAGGGLDLLRGQWLVVQKTFELRAVQISLA